MKFTTVFAVITTLVTAVSATLGYEYNTNAKRLANGMGPLPPARRGGSHGMPHGTPHGTPTHGM